MTHSDIDSPEDLPEGLSAVLEEYDDSQLRDIINHAQRLLRDHPPLTEAIEARHGEEIVRTEEYDAYTIVVVERPAEVGEARGPFAYRVQWEPKIDDGEGRYKWHYLGRVTETPSTDRDD
ncbi:hypothetical protein [Halorubrum sp. FL23]|uniref:hypothetical protein n=1 Tax=Halorubrum sp. FL23 TaxID=3458704 RepID=UPI004034ED03